MAIEWIVWGAVLAGVVFWLGRSSVTVRPTIVCPFAAGQNVDVVDPPTKAKAADDGESETAFWRNLYDGDPR